MGVEHDKKQEGNALRSLDSPGAHKRLRSTTGASETPEALDSRRASCTGPSLVHAPTHFLGPPSDSSQTHVDLRHPALVARACSGHAITLRRNDQRLRTLDLHTASYYAS